MRPGALALTFGLGRRLTLVFGLLIAGFVASAVVTNTLIQRQLIERRLEARALDLGELAAEVTASYLYDMRIAELEIIYEDIERQSDVDFIYFVDADGLKLASGRIGTSDTSSFLAVVEDALIERAARTGEVERWRDAHLEHVARPVTLGKERLGTVRFAIARDEYERELNTVWQRNLLVGALFILGGMYLTGIVARRLTRPLGALTAMTERAARGEFDQRIELETNDELEVLARSFNLMLGTVRDNLAEIHRLAFTDKLTGLHNRAWFQTALERSVEEAGRENRLAALLFLDLDQFKRLNDSLGHHVGDALLRLVAERVRACIRAAGVLSGAPGGHDATLCRLGGDEFTVVLPRLGAREDAARIAERIIAALAAPFDFDGTPYTASASIGIAICPDDAATPDALLKHADIAMYQAKHAGRNTYRFYDAQMASLSVQRLMLERELRAAIDEGHLEIHLQPQFAVPDGALMGAEALVRWRHPEKGLIRPDHFLPVAADARMMPALGRWVIKTALGHAREWAFFRDRPLRLAINISVEELEAEDFAAWVIEAIRAAGVDPTSIELEMTENVAMVDSEKVEAQVRLLRAAGVRFAVDDFGVGYSNLARLKQLAFETLKIDRGLMQGVGADREAEALVASILGMAKALNLEVVAEGIETAAQLAFLRRHGCEYAQGYLLARPMPSDEFRRWIRAETLAFVDRQRVEPPFVADAGR